MVVCFTESKMPKKTITVIKRDNTKEALDETKIVRVAKATGLTDEEARVVADAILAKIEVGLTDTNREIKSTQIRDFFLQELKSANRYAAGLYEWYEKSKANPTS